MGLRKAWYDGWPVMREGPGRGWWGPPKGTHVGKKPDKGVGGGGKPLDFEKLGYGEARKATIANLKPDDELVLYHGTRDPELAASLIENGFRADEAPKSRIYVGTLAPEKGFFVSPDRHVGESFGSYVVEFTAPARKLQARPQRLPAGETPDSFWRSSYPSSFRPGLSESLSLSESQGLLTQNVAGNRVRQVWRWSKSQGEWYPTSPKEFVAEIRGK